MKKLRDRSLSKKLFQPISFIVLIALVLSACAPAAIPDSPAIIPSPTSQPAQPLPVSREVQVQSVEIEFQEGPPVQVNAIVRGSLTESCAVLGESQVEYAANTFKITIPAISPSDTGCAQVTSPFVTTIPLPAQDLPAGTYTVTANGVSGVFTWPVAAATMSAQIVSLQVPPTAVPVVSACTDKAAFVSDVTVPDNSIIAANTAFTKTWRIKNTGTCTWDSSYLVFYISGATMSQSPAYLIVPKGQTVAPGQTVDISVGMTSPVDNGSYQSYWGLKKENGQFMPIEGGANGNSFYLKIKITDGRGTSTGNITDQSIGIVLEQGSGIPCTPDSTYFVTASITADGPATASYEIGSTAGQIPAGYFQPSPMGPVSYQVTGTLEFTRADRKLIALHFVGPYPHPDDITVFLRVNGGEFYSAKLSCQ
jgi:hypothetical protein